MENKETHIHKFTKHEIPSTCKEHGYTLHKCECGYEHKDNFKPLAPHKFEVFEETKPTCTEAGTQKLRCTVCGEIQTKSLSPLGHAWDEWVVESFATCTEEGKQFRTCKRCGTKEDAIIKAKGHKLTNPKKSTTEKGMIDYFCTNCGQTISLPSKGNKFKSFLAKNKKKIITYACAAALLVVICIIGVNTAEYFIKEYHYAAAKESIREKDYLDAYSHLNKCIGHKGADTLRDDFVVYHESRTVTMSSTFSYESEFKYDKHGNLTHVYVYDDDGDFQSLDEYKYKYDNDGNVSQVEMYTTDDDDKRELEYKSNYTYNKSGDLVKVTTIKDEETVVYVYSSEGNIASITHLDEDGNVSSESLYDKNGNKTTTKSPSYTYKYSSRGGITNYTSKSSNVKFKRNFITGTSEIRIYAGNDNLSAKQVYDKNGNLIKVINYDENGKLISKITHKYRDDGTIVSSKFYNKDGKLARTSKYDKYENMTYIEARIMNPNTPTTVDTRTTKYKYDKHGIKAQESSKNTSKQGLKTVNSLHHKCQYGDPVVWYCPGR